MVTTAGVRIAALALTVLVQTLTMSARAGDTESRNAEAGSGSSIERLELGRRMYLEGVLPSGEMMMATVRGDIKVTGDQVICGNCHRRSGMGSSEGQEVVPAVRGNILAEPLRLPTSKPPLAPEIRPAYSDETLKRAIRHGIDANGEELDAFMPRYSLSDAELDILLGYLNTLGGDPAPGVTAQDIHFATIVADSVPAASRKAMLDVMQVFLQQKNTETRHESSRAANAPWHKAWVLEPYRKWVLHVWELHGARETWPAQLQAQYRRQPVFAVLGGVAPGSWRPMHEFCESMQIPCLFPTTDLPVRNEQDFYTVYLNGGMALEGEAVAQHLADDDLLAGPVVQVFRDDDAAGMTAAAALRRGLAGRGVTVKDVTLTSGEAARALLEGGDETVAAVWLREADLQAFWKQLDASNAPGRVYLSTTLYDGDYEGIPRSMRERVYFVHPQELPDKLPRLLARSSGWLRLKRIYSPENARIQANSYFVMKMAGGALRAIRGYFNRDYFLERVEHMVDNANYTSVYPRMSLAPNQRFVSKGCYIARLSDAGAGGLVAVSGWLIPGSK